MYHTSSGCAVLAVAPSASSHEIQVVLAVAHSGDVVCWIQRDGTTRSGEYGLDAALRAWEHRTGALTAPSLKYAAMLVEARHLQALAKDRLRVPAGSAS